MTLQLRHIKTGTAKGATPPTAGTRRRAATRPTAGTRPRQCATRPTVATRRARGDRLTRPGRGDGRGPGKGNILKKVWIYIFLNKLKPKILMW